MRGRVPCGEGIAAEFAKDPQQGLRRGLRKDLRRDLQWDLQRDPQWTRSRTCSRIRSRTCAVFAAHRFWNVCLPGGGSSPLVWLSVASQAEGTPPFPPLFYAYKPVGAALRRCAGAGLPEARWVRGGDTTRIPGFAAAASAPIPTVGGGCLCDAVRCCGEGMDECEEGGLHGGWRSRVA